MTITLAMVLKACGTITLIGGAAAYLAKVFEKFAKYGLY